MTPWLKIGIIAAYTALIAFVTWHAHSVTDRANQEAAIAAQAAADHAAQQQAADQLAAIEKELSQERLKSASLEHQWSMERAKITDCKLPAAGLSLLRQARGARSPAR